MSDFAALRPRIARFADGIVRELSGRPAPAMELGAGMVLQLGNAAGEEVGGALHAEGADLRAAFGAALEQVQHPPVQVVGPGLIHANRAEGGWTLLLRDDVQLAELGAEGPLVFWLHDEGITVGPAEAPSTWEAFLADERTVQPPMTRLEGKLVPWVGDDEVVLEKIRRAAGALHAREYGLITDGLRARGIEVGAFQTLEDGTTAATWEGDGRLPWTDWLDVVLPDGTYRVTRNLALRLAGQLPANEPPSFRRAMLTLTAFPLELAGAVPVLGARVDGAPVGL